MKPLNINNAWNEIFAVISMVLQRVINESSMKKHWKIKDSDVNTTKTIKIKKVSIDVYLVLLHCWDDPNLEELLTYNLSLYNAEPFLIL